MQHIRLTKSELGAIINAMNIGFLSAMNWYGFIIGCGIVICVVCAYFTAKRRGIEGDMVIDIIIICLPLAIIGARIYHVIFSILDGDHWTFKKFIGLEDGGLEGLAIYGGLIGAVIGAVILWLWKNRKKNPENKRISFMQLLDLGFTFIILGQSIGRWGNFVNQEIYGNKITNPALQFFPIGVFIDRDSSWHYATFFYESMWNIVGFGLLLFLYIGRRKSFDGFVFSVYCIYYGIGRAWIEGMRDAPLWLVPPSNGFGGIPVSQFLSVLLIILGAAYIIIHCVRAKKADQKIFIFVDQNKLDESYFGYDKTKLAHPMPDIKFYKDRKKSAGGTDENIVVDRNGVAVRLDDTKAEASCSSDAAIVADDKQSVEKPQIKQKEVKAEETYEDKWDD